MRVKEKKNNEEECLISRFILIYSFKKTNKNETFLIIQTRYILFIYRYMYKY